MVKKPLWEKTFECPLCSKSVHIRVERECINDPIPAEYDLKEIIEKSNQKTLETSQ